MPYCRKCGAKNEQSDSYCHKCGFPITADIQESTPTKTSLKRNQFFIPIIIIIVASIFVLIIAAIASAPLNPVNFSQSSDIVLPGASSLNLTFWADIADVNIFTNLTGNSVMMIDVKATGGTSIFSSNQPITVDILNSTNKENAIVNVLVNAGKYPSTSNIQVFVNIYVNPTLDLTINAYSRVGNIDLNTDTEARIDALNLHVSTGNLILNIQESTSINGYVSLWSAIGNVEFSMNKADLDNNTTIFLQSSTGNVKMDITQTKRMDESLQIYARTGTGQVSLDQLLIDGEVGSKIEAETGLGEIITDIHNFTGEKSPLESNNYPATSNINIQMETGIGNINIHATYQSGNTIMIRN